MYVVELDRPWLGMPFASQGFHLISANQIDDLKKHCQSVFIDLDNELPNDPHLGNDVAKVSLRVSADASIEPGLPTGNRPRYLEMTPVEKELSVAKEVYSACEEGVQASLETMRLEGDWDPIPVKNAVDSMTKSIERNPDAMMLLFKIKQKIGQEFNRAVDTSIHMITFGRFLQLPDEQLQLLGLAGLFLDIGKVKLPDTILQKKSGLSAEEYEFVKTHVMHSVELVRAAPGLPKGLEDIVVQHHERIDGSGYPRGLRGGQITLNGAIAGLVDSYSAITSTRPYAEQSSPSAALNQLYKLRGKLFDATLVEQFIQCIGIYPVGSAVELNTGEVGIVIAQNLARRLQPRVILILDQHLKPTPQVILDLAKEPKATPDEPYRIRRTFPRDKLPIDFEKFLT
jgi:HD-GYP domain-containing protein (c-di-GMP phosphodiesterase class II)